MGVLYNLAISVANVILKLLAPFNSKLGHWNKGRDNLFEELQKEINPTDKIIWFHSASLGEYEQGRPIIDLMKEKHPSHKILITFFSPSGYEVIKAKNSTDLIFYMPFDLNSNVKEFLNIVDPKIVFFIKYEFWFNYLQELQQRKIPTIFISSLFRREQFFFSWYGKWFLNIIKKVDHLFVQDQSSYDLLSEFNLNNVAVIGDTRFDRVLEKSARKKPVDLIELFKGNAKLLVAGSTWNKDVDVLMDFMNRPQSDVKFLIAPHEVDDNTIESILKQFKGSATRFSGLTKENAATCGLVVIDSIGILSNMYQYGDFTFIGGGFGEGIHNLLEPASHSQPLFFGPNYSKFIEAKELIELGAAQCVSNKKEFGDAIEMLIMDAELITKKGSISSKYVKDNSGSSVVISEKIERLIG
ncbi:MAG: 3-deoxy-D-manno-octulosonic acid transferase [Flavobacteriales bacterium]|nr:3-deoxy-D-manno-octulosonic acid transferase [Flavobacteriales bacterium]